jgi:SAM-dependent methyltransferase
VSDHVEVPDALFADPELAVLYDFVDNDRRDLNVYVAIAEELGASSVLDVGCGTGNLACRLARTGLRVVGLDPAAASLDVARRKTGADHVHWIHGDVTDLPQLEVDLVVMTGNVAMVFLSDDEWSRVLSVSQSALSDDGWLVFETRDPSRRGWEHWTKHETYRTIEVPRIGLIDTWIELTDVRLPHVSFRQTFRFRADGVERTSGSMLRLRTPDEVTKGLKHAGLRLREVRDAPDRPGLEHVYFTQSDSPNVC